MTESLVKRATPVDEVIPPTGDGAPPARRRPRRTVLVVPWILVVPGLALALLAHFVAPAFGAVYAFTDWRGVGSFRFVGLANFVEIFGSDEDRLAVTNSLKLALVFVVLVTAIGLLLAILLHRPMRGGSALRSLFFLPAVMIPLSVTQVWKYILDFDGPLNRILRGLGLRDWTRNWLGDVHFALWMILVVLLWQYVGYAMIIFHAGLQLIPEELTEAAALDGAGAWQRFRHVVLPLLAPSTTIVVVLMTITGLRVFDQVLGLTGGGPANTTQTLASYLYETTFVDGRYGYGTSLALLLTVLVVVVGLAQTVVLRRREEALRG